MSEPTFLVPVWAADGPVLVPHTREQYAALWAGVDPEATRVLTMEEPDERYPCPY